MKTPSRLHASMLLLPLGLMAGPAVADVCNASTAAQFQACLTAAAASAEDSVINLAAGTYSVANNGGMPFTYLVKPACNSGAQAYSLTINGAGAGSTFLDGANLHQVLHIRHDRFGVQCWPNPPGTANPPDEVTNDNSDANATITVRGVTVRNGRMQPIPAARDQQSSSCGFEDVSEQAGGMAIKVYRAGIVVEDSVFVNNGGVEGGGAKIHKACGATNVQVVRNRFENNFTQSAASVNFWYDDTVGTTCEVSLTEVVGWSTSNLGSFNSQSGGGAKISARDGRVQVFDNVFVGNATNSGLSTSGSPDGGGLSGKGIFGLVWEGLMNPPSCPDSTSPWNIGGSGGSVWDIERNLFENNVSNGGDGGGAHLWGNMHLADNRFFNNEARVIPGQSDAGDGGGLHIFSKSAFETAILTRNHFLGNQAGGQGGGLQLRSPTTRTDVTASVFSQNSSDGFVWTEDYELKLSQGGGGGAFMYTDHGELNFVSNSVCANTATAGYTATRPRAKGHGGGVVVFAQLSLDDSAKSSISNGCKDCVDNVPDGSMAKANIYSNMIWGNSAAGLGQDLFIEDVNENEIIWDNGDPEIRDQTGSEINLFFNNVGNWLQVCGNDPFAFPDPGGCLDDLRAHENTALNPQFVNLDLCAVNPNSPAASLTANRNFDPTTVGLPAGSFDPSVFPATDFFGNPFDPDNPRVGSMQEPMAPACGPELPDFVGGPHPILLDCLVQQAIDNVAAGIAGFCATTGPTLQGQHPNVDLVLEAFCGGMAPSDARLKEDIVPVGFADNGLPLYRFRYAGGNAVYEGVLAQDVLAYDPEAVGLLTGGYLAVDYQRLGLELRVVSPL